MAHFVFDSSKARKQGVIAIFIYPRNQRLALMSARRQDCL